MKKLYSLLLLSLLCIFICTCNAQQCNEAGECTQPTEDVVKTEDINPVDKPHIAIIGSGIAGSSTAHYLKKLVPEADITVYDKENRVCGRVLDFYVEGKKVEIGASIYHKINHNIVDFVKEFNLTARKPFHNDTAMAIWDGVEFVHRQSEMPFIGGYIDIVKLFWRYGMAPLNFKSVVDKMLASWEQLYDFVEPFETTEELFQKINLTELAQTTAPEYLESQGVARTFVRELLGALTRVNYNTDVAEMNAFAVGVSAVGSGNDLFSVEEGNKVICQKLLSSAKAQTKLETPVTEILQVMDSTKYAVNGKDVYDVVVIATPLELSGIGLPGINEDEYLFNARHYQEVHVTFVAAKALRPSYFQQTDSVPDHILTVENPTIPFSSVSRLNDIHVADGRPVFKVFSRTALSDQLLLDLFNNGTVINTKPIKAYPKLKPQKLVPITLANNMYYVNSFESVVSTMETEAISGKNVAKLIAKALGRTVQKI